MWMEDSDVEDLAKETLFKQFSIIRKNTTTSHVQVLNRVFFSFNDDNFLLVVTDRN